MVKQTQATAPSDKNAGKAPVSWRNYKPQYKFPPKTIYDSRWGPFDRCIQQNRRNNRAYYRNANRRKALIAIKRSFEDQRPPKPEDYRLLDNDRTRAWRAAHEWYQPPIKYECLDWDNDIVLGTDPRWRPPLWVGPPMNKEWKPYFCRSVYSFLMTEWLPQL
jgi:hypothetical protein